MKMDEEDKATLAALEAAYGEGWEWDEDDETFTYEGEHCDGEATWTIERFNGFNIHREEGWYEQRGEAQSVAELVHVMAAMDAASKALNDYMLKKGRE